MDNTTAEAIVSGLMLELHDCRRELLSKEDDVKAIMARIADINRRVNELEVDMRGAACEESTEQAQ